MIACVGGDLGRIDTGFGGEKGEGMDWNYVEFYGREREGGKESMHDEKVDWVRHAQLVWIVDV